MVLPYVENRDEDDDPSGGLARLGLPMRSRPRPEVLPARARALADASYDDQLAAVGELVGDSWAPGVLAAYGPDWSASPSGAPPKTSNRSTSPRSPVAGLVDRTPAVSDTGQLDGVLVIGHGRDGLAARALGLKWW